MAEEAEAEGPRFHRDMSSRLRPIAAKDLESRIDLDSFVAVSRDPALFPPAVEIKISFARRHAIPCEDQKMMRRLRLKMQLRETTFFSTFLLGGSGRNSLNVLVQWRNKSAPWESSRGWLLDKVFQPAIMKLRDDTVSRSYGTTASSGQSTSITIFQRFVSNLFLAPSSATTMFANPSLCARFITETGPVTLWRWWMPSSMFATLL